MFKASEIFNDDNFLFCGEIIPVVTINNVNYFDFKSLGNMSSDYAYNMLLRAFQVYAILHHRHAVMVYINILESLRCVWQCCDMSESIEKVIDLFYDYNQGNITLKDVCLSNDYKIASKFRNQKDWLSPVAHMISIMESKYATPVGMFFSYAVDAVVSYYFKKYHYCQASRRFKRNRYDGATRLSWENLQKTINFEVLRQFFVGKDHITLNPRYFSCIFANARYDSNIYKHNKHLKITEEDRCYYDDMEKKNEKI